MKTNTAMHFQLDVQLSKTPLHWWMYFFLMSMIYNFLGSFHNSYAKSLPGVYVYLSIYLFIIDNVPNRSVKPRTCMQNKLYLIVAGEAFVHDVVEVHQEVTVGQHVLMFGHHLTDQLIRLELPSLEL